ncbi:hypothetical protein QZM22_04345 [Burkholderia oklahomensis]|uniref:hypothetical protein n=1 Tax=Burkholderia oklahomensis TaxID=342113 RepID=UPI00264ED06E|nr:hypothetical protein [Burkholderia oklahomensis]MDN7671772.1 hypothetical protein [Burkholderia oklahomensis]
MSSSSKASVIRRLIADWTSYHSSIEPEAKRYRRLSQDLYQVRNPGLNGSPPLSSWPKHLLDPDDEIMACVEHYFLARAWIGTGRLPAWELRTLSSIYNVGKLLGVTPRHNPDNPVTPPSQLQRSFQMEGVIAGKVDRAKAGVRAPLVKSPPTY